MHGNSVPLTVFFFFRSSVVALSQLNDLFSCFNPWIITPSVFDDISLVSVDPIFTTVAYAILEPTVTRDLLRLKLPPWGLLIGLSPIHLMWSLMSMDGYDYVQHVIRQTRDIVASELNKPPSAEAALRNKSFLYQLYISLTLVVPVFTSAVINGNLLLLSQSLYAPSLLEQDPLVLLLVSFAVLFYLGSRIADYVICTHTRRWRSIGPGFFYQVILFVIRAYVRSMTGFTSLMPFQMPSEKEAEQNFKLANYQWIEATVPKLMLRSFCVLSFTGTACMLLGRHFMAQSNNESPRRDESTVPRILSETKS